MKTLIKNILEFTLIFFLFLMLWVTLP